MFKSKTKEKQIIALPLILVVFDKLIGDKSNNREIMIRNLNLPFEIDLIKNEVWIIERDEILSRNLKRVQAIVVNVSKDPQTVVEAVKANLSVYEENRKLLIHYTAKSYAAMNDEQKNEWRTTPASERIAPKNLSKLIPIPVETKPKELKK